MFGLCAFCQRTHLNAFHETQTYCWDYCHAWQRECSPCWNTWTLVDGHLEFYLTYAFPSVCHGTALNLFFEHLYDSDGLWQHEFDVCLFHLSFCHLQIFLVQTFLIFLLTYKVWHSVCLQKLPLGILLSQSFPSALELYLTQPQDLLASLSSLVVQ